MEKEILRHIPLDSSIYDAEKIMKQNGFKCNRVENQSYGEQSQFAINSAAEKISRNTASGLLFCDATHSYFIFGYTRWNVTLVFKNEVIKDVRVHSGNVAL